MYMHYFVGPITVFIPSNAAFEKLRHNEINVFFLKIIFSLIQLDTRSIFHTKHKVHEMVVDVY
jgi:hypothetical protein